MPSKADYREDLELLEDLLKGASSDQVKLEVLRYFNLARPYFIPKRVSQEIKLHTDRICDLIGGIPYTSRKHVWPVDPKTKEGLQPILQLRLEKAGRLLKTDSGKGLLQIFGYSTRAYGYLQFQHRVIGPEDLREPADTAIPESIAESIKFGEKIQSKPKILWRNAGRMLMGNFSYVKLNDEHGFSTAGDESLTFDESETNFSSSCIELNESYEILEYLRSTPYFGTYLGGYGGSSGSLGKFLNIDPAKGFLLIRTGSDEDDAHVGVNALYCEGGQLMFKVDGCFV